MFRRILVANRGEVAYRVIRTCRRLGVETVAVVSSADKGMAWLTEADRVVCIGGPHPRDSYLDADAIIEAARRERCSAVHPGWGFLAENPVFAARCEAVGLTFVGPPAHLVRILGDKLEARKALAGHGLPFVPASEAPVTTPRQARHQASALGYPVLLKAAAGGGGRGMVRVSVPDAMDTAFDLAHQQAAAAFGDPTIYVERVVHPARHVEFQVLVDAYGTGRYLGSRDCSLQRRHQKLVEEAPAPRVDRAVLDDAGERAARALAALGYRGAGTVEMLLEPCGALHLLECNARLQVEHGVTEMHTGIDLVEAQLRIAAGEALGPPPEAGPVTHALECRINAEDPWNDFRPHPGRVRFVSWPPADLARVDTHLPRPHDTAGFQPIPPYYDSLLCKIITGGTSREQAIERMRQALDATRFEGLPTTRPLVRALLDLPRFRSGEVDTGLVEARLADLSARFGPAPPDREPSSDPSDAPC